MRLDNKHNVVNAIYLIHANLTLFGVRAPTSVVLSRSLAPVAPASGPSSGRIIATSCNTRSR